ncbi:hypothetical protein ACZ90_00685 [Streptomyces albus subsp. albus]|nr:hypothetical protein ACZ90_00685 [Streptomyces albus subsp. albus]
MRVSPEKTGRGGSRGPDWRELATPARITAAVIGVLGLIFIFENTRQVKIRLLIPEVTMPLWLALLTVGLIGVLCGAFLFRQRRR